MTRTPQNNEHPLRSGRVRWCILGLAASCLLLSMAVLPYAIRRQPFSFDDAYIFFRYAWNIRHGLGIAWNPDGVPTYGMPGQLWVFVVLPFTFLGTAADISLRLASWVTGEVALLVLALTVARHSRSEFLRFPPLALIAVALPLLLNPRFAYHMTTGMDTMLSLLANALLILAVLEYARRPAPGRAILAGIVGCTAILVRPENALCALTAPLIAWAGVSSPGQRRDAAAFLSTLVLLTGLDLILCERYFGVALPVSFAGKSLAAYAGFMSGENSLGYAFTAAFCVLPFIGILGATFAQGNRNNTLALLLPAAATLLYLLCVRQHMGFQGRYYTPFFPFIVVPALLSLDAGFCRSLRHTAVRAAFGCLAAFAAFGLSLPVQRYLDRVYLGWVMPQAIAVPELATQARTPLPQTDWLATIAVVGQMASRLPSTAVVAAAEVGFVGYAARDKTIIDLVGVNDAVIGARGFSPSRLLDRAPDLIWLPPLDYTGLRAALLSDPRLFSHYEVIAGAFNNGVAILDGPHRDAVEAEVRRAWSTLYPGVEMQSYVARNPAGR